MKKELLPERFQKYEHIVDSEKTERKKKVQIAWFIQFDKFILFREEHGHGDVSINQDKPLAQWVNKQRSRKSERDEKKGHHPPLSDFDV